MDFSIRSEVKRRTPQEQVGVDVLVRECPGGVTQFTPLTPAGWQWWEDEVGVFGLQLVQSFCVRNGRLAVAEMKDDGLTLGDG